jgi:hypothetical protein
MYLAPGRLLTPIAGGAPASLDLDFMSGSAATLDSRIAFSRASLAWMTDSSGTITTAPHNLRTSSNEMATIFATQEGCSFTHNVLAAPDGTTTADKMVEDGTNAVHRLRSSVTVGSVAVAHTFSIYMKAAGRTSVTLILADSTASVANNVAVVANLSAGTIGSVTAAGTGVAGTASITDAGNSWYRVALSGSFASGTAFATWLSLGTYAGDGTSGLYLWGAQLEQHTAARDYLNTSVRNLLGFSEQFDNAAWTKTRATVTANAVAGPSPFDAATNADKLSEQTDVATSRNVQQSYSVTSGVTYGFSVYAKAAERSAINLRPGNGFAAGNVTFDLFAGTLTNTGSVAASSITAAGSGWYRCFAAFAATSSTTGAAQILLSSGGVVSYDGVAGNGIYLFGAQLSSSGSLDAYSPVASAAPTSAAYHGPRFDYDGATLAARGLLIEEARTNLILNSVTLSDWTITAATRTLNAATGLDGTTSASRFVATATGNSTPSITATVVAATAYAFSICFKLEGSSFTWVRLRFVAGANTFNVWANVSTGALGTVTAASSEMTAFAGITPVSLGGGWWRIGATFTTTVTSVTIAVAPATANGSGTMTVADTWLMGHAQLEAGSFATSPILTTTAAVTRAADVASMPVGSWFDTTQGTLVAEFQTFSSGNNFAAQISDNSYNNRILVGFDATSFVGQAIVSGSATLAPTARPVRTTGTAKIALAWAANDANLAGNGTLSTADTSGAVPTGLTRLDIGSDQGGLNRLSGWVRRLRVYQSRLPDAKLQVITS